MKPEAREGSTQRDNLINKAKDLNTQITEIDEELDSIVKELNQNNDPEQNINKLDPRSILNNYFNALYWIETRTVIFL